MRVMNRILFTALLFVVTLTPAFATDFSFTPADVVDGTSWTETGAYHTHLTITLHDSARQITAIPPATPGGAPTPITRDVDVTRSKTVTIVTAAANDRISVMDVTYTDGPAFVLNKTYRLTVQGNHAGIAYGGTTTGTPSVEEVAFVDGDNAHFGQLRALNRIFGKKSFSVGDNVRVNKNDAEELINVSDDLDVSDLTVTLTDVTNNVATFSMSLTLQSTIKKGSPDQTDGFSTGGMTIVLTGQLQLNTTNCRPTTMALAGTATLNGSKPAAGHSQGHDATMTVSGDGTTSFNFTYGF